MKFKVKLSELYKIIEEEYQLVNGNSSAWGLPGNWAAKVAPAQEIEESRMGDLHLEIQDALSEIMQQYGVGLEDIEGVLGDMMSEQGDGAIDRGYMEEPEGGHASPAHYQEAQDLSESAMIDLAVLGYLWDNLGVPGSLDKFINSTRGVDKKIDDWFKNNMKNPLVRGLYKALMLTGSPGDNYRHDKKWEKEQQQAKGLEESVKKYVVRFLNGKNK